MILTVNDLVNYTYCPRMIFFARVLNIKKNARRDYKVRRGDQAHKHRETFNKTYLRKRIKVVKKMINVYLYNDVLSGRVDEILWLEDGSVAPLDYKFSVYKNTVYNTVRTQLAAYALLIEDNFAVEVNSGFVVYIRSNNLMVRVNIGEKQKNDVKEKINKIAKIIDGNYYPQPTRYKNRCRTCEYRNMCEEWMRKRDF